MLQTYCNHLVLKIIRIIEEKVDKSIQAGKALIQPYAFFFFQTVDKTGAGKRKMKVLLK